MVVSVTAVNDRPGIVIAVYYLREQYRLLIIYESRFITCYVVSCNSDLPVSYYCFS